MKMKKKIIIFSLLCLLIVCMIPFAIYATNYVDTITGIYVYGERVATYNSHGDGWSYDFENNVLTLDSASFTQPQKAYQIDTSSTARAFIYVSSSWTTNFKIELKGGASTLGNAELYNSESTQGFETYGIYAPGVSLTIESLAGSGEAGLWIWTNRFGVYCENLTLNNTTVNVKSFYDVFYVNTRMEVSSSFVNVEGHTSYGKLDSVLEVGGNYDRPGTLIVRDSEVYARGTYREVGNYDTISYCHGIYAYNIEAYGENTRVYGYAVAGDRKGKYNEKIDSSGIFVDHLKVGGGAYVYGETVGTSYLTFWYSYGVWLRISTSDITFTGSGTVEGYASDEPKNCRQGIKSFDNVINVKYEDCINDFTTKKEHWCFNHKRSESHHTVISAASATTLYVRDKDGKVNYSLKSDFGDGGTDVESGIIDMSVFTYKKYDRETKSDYTAEYNVVACDGAEVTIKPTSSDSIKRGTYIAESGAEITVQLENGVVYPTVEMFWNTFPSIDLCIKSGGKAYITGGGVIKELYVNGNDTDDDTLGGNLYVENGTICSGSINNASVYMSGGNNNVEGTNYSVYMGKDGTTNLDKWIYDFGDRSLDDLNVVVTGWDLENAELIDGKLYLWGLEFPLSAVTIKDDGKQLTCSLIDEASKSFEIVTPEPKTLMLFDSPTTSFERLVGEKLTLDSKGRFVSRTYGVQGYTPQDETLSGVPDGCRIEWSYVDSRTGAKTVPSSGSGFTYTINEITADDEFRDYICTAYSTKDGEEQAIGQLKFRIYVMSFDYLPEDTEVVIGETVQFKYSMSSDSRKVDGKYEWRNCYTCNWQVSSDGGTTWTDIEGENSSFYSVSLLKAEDFGLKYRIRFYLNENIIKPYGTTEVFPTIREFCTDAFKISKSEEDVIESASVLIGESISMEYIVRDIGLAGDHNLVMKFTMNENEVTVTGKRNDNGTIAFIFDDIAPHLMTDNISAELLLVYKDGDTEKTVSVDKYEDYSIVDYAKEILDSTDYEYSTELKQAISEMLRYGAAAQKYKNYKTDSLATSYVENLEDEIEANATSVRNLTKANDVELGDVRFSAVSVWFGDENRIYVKLRSYTENTKLRVTRKTIDLYTGEETMSTTLEYDMSSTEFYTDKISAIELDDVFTFELYENDVLQQTLTYSISSYIYVIQEKGSSTPMTELANNLSRYGTAAKAYIKSISATEGGVTI